MAALTIGLPRKSSRMSTHAVIVPSSAFVSAASAATASVSFSAATASGDETAAQKPEPPPFVDDQTSAAIGSATTTDRNAPTKPTASAEPPRRGSQADGAAPLSARRRPSDGALDPDHQPRARVEPLPVGCAPTADRRVVDRELSGPGRELLRELLCRDGVHGAEAVLPEDLLLGLRLHEADELVRDVAVPGRLDHRDRQLDQDRLARDHVLDVLTLEARVDRFALVRDQDVALARQERVRRVAARGVLRDDVLKQLLDVCDRLRVRLAEVALRRVCGEDVPPRRAGAERVRRHDVHARLDEVGPALDVLRVA